MPALLLRRALRLVGDLVLVLLVVSAVVVLLLRVTPGDPLAMLQADARVTPAVRAAWTHAFDPTQSWMAQTVGLWRGVIGGDLGWSWSQQRPVAEVLGEALPWTALLMTLALTGAAGLGLLGGTLLAAHRTAAPARWTLRALRLLAAVPDAWLALLLVLAFAVAWPVLPLQGVCDVRHCGDASTAQGPPWSDVARHTVLPALTLTLLALTRFARAQRAAVLPLLASPLVPAVRARGVGESRLLWHHLVRGALTPWLVLVAVSLPQLVGGAVFVERVFGWPGAGQLLVQAVGARDYALVFALALCASALTVSGTFLLDVVTAWLDPRLRRA